MSLFLTDLQAELSAFAQTGEFGVLLGALAAGLLLSVACGVIGSYVVVRRISYIAGGIAHCVLGGIGAAIYCRGALGWSWVDPVWGRQWLTPMTGAVVAALLAAALIGVVSMRFRQREDTVISAMWAVGMSAGVLFMWATPGYQQKHLMGYLIGNILVVGGEHLVLIAILDVVVVAVSVLLYKQFLAVCFDEEFARTRGLRTDVYYMLLLCLAALTVVLLAAIVGIVMVIALLTLPAATAGQCTRRLWRMMVLAGVLCAAETTAGLAVSYEPRLSPGATIIILSAGVFLAALAVKALGRILRGTSRRPGRRTRRTAGGTAGSPRTTRPGASGDRN